MHTYLRLLLSVGVLAIGSCTQVDSSLNTKQLAEELGYSEFPLVSDAPEGFVDFYMGSEVLKEIASTGTYQPDWSKTFSMIRVKKTLVDSVESSKTPTSVSICNPSWEITLLGNRIVKPGANDRFLTPGSVNCTPWIERASERTTFTLRSGMEGLRGFIQIGVNARGNLTAGAVVSGRLQSVCPDGGQSDAAMVLGTIVEDAVEGDPMLSTCVVTAQ